MARPKDAHLFPEVRAKPGIQRAAGDDALLPGQKTVVVEDLISTGGSVAEVVSVLRAAGADVLGVVSIFTYGMKKGKERLASEGIKNVSLTDFDTVARIAAQTGYVKKEDVARLLAFRDDPSDESWIRR